MKRQRQKLIGAFILAVIAFMLVSVVGIDGLSTFMFGGGAIFAMAGAIVGPGTSAEGTVTQETYKAVEELTEEDLNRMIVKVRPSDTPLDTLTREINNTQKVESRECGGYEIGTRDISDITLASIAEAGDVKAMKVSKKDMWQTYETILVDGYIGSDGKPLMLYIVDKTPADSTITVVPVNGVGGNVPTIVEGTKLLRLGNAMAELDAQTTVFSALPSNRKNYTQIHMTQVEVSHLSELQKKKVAIDFSTHKELAIWDMKRRMELTNFFGIKGKTINPLKNNDLVYTSEGLWHQTPNAFEIDWSKKPTNADWVAMTRNIFDGNNGSDRRMLFAGPEFIEWISHVDAYTKQVEAKNVEVVHGVRVNRIETSFGQLLVKSLSGLFVGEYSKCGLVLDMSYVTKYVHEALQTTPLELDKTGQRRAKAHRILENYALFLENLDAHRKIRPIYGSATTHYISTDATTAATTAATTEATTQG